MVPTLAAPAITECPGYGGSSSVMSTVGSTSAAVGSSCAGMRTCHTLKFATMGPIVGTVASTVSL